MSHHALVGTPPGSLPCDCFSFPLATNMATGGGLSYPLGPGCCMCAQKFFFSANLSVGAIQPKRGLPKVGAIQAKRCLPTVGAIQPTSGWGYPAQKVLAKGWGYPAHKRLGAIQPKRCLPKAGAIQPKSVWAIQPRKCCQKLGLSSPKVLGLSSPRGAATGRCCFFFLPYPSVSASASYLHLFPSPDFT